MSDLRAYQRLGLPEEHIYIVGENGGKKGTLNLGHSFKEHLEQIQDQDAVTQPFAK